MRKAKTRIGSILLVVAMLMTLLPTAALADEFVPTEQELIDAEKYQAAFDKDKNWENLGNAALNYNYAKTYVGNLEDGDEKEAAQARLDILTAYYEGITELDMSGKKGGYGGDDGRHGCLSILTNLTKLNLSDTGITNVGPLQYLTNLEELDISNNPISDLGALVGLTKLTKLDASNTDLDSNDFGALVDKSLTRLDLSGTDITSIGPITTNGGDNVACAQTLTYLDVSNTGLTQLQEVWNGTSRSASLPALKTLNAKGLSLTSISGLAEIANANGFSADGITWDLSGSTLSADADNHIALISSKLSSGFTAPAVSGTAAYSLAKAEQWKNTIDEQLGSDNGKAALTWKSLIFGNYWFNQAKTGINEMSEDADKAALETRWNAIDTYYKSVTAIDMSGKTDVPDGYAKSMGVFNIFPNLTKLDVSNTGLSDFGIGTGAAGLVNLEELNLSGLTCNTENTLFGGLVGLNNLKVLDISDITGVTDIGGLVGANVADTITTLNISNTSVTKLESIWDKDGSKPNFPELTTLTAHGLELESISGLAEIAADDAFDPSDITWDFGTDDTQSTVTDDGSSLAPVHVVMIRLAFADAETGTFNAPETDANAAYSAIRYQKNITNSLDISGSASLSWDTVITAKYWRTTAESYIDSLSDGDAKTALTNLMADVDAEYAKITELDMSGKTESQYAISTDAVNLFPNLTTLNLSGTGISDTGGLAPLTKLQSLDLSDNAGITDSNLGALNGMNELAILNLSGTGITDIGGLVANEVSDTITTLDISDTKVTKLESIWDSSSSESAFPKLTTLIARNLKLTSISGLVEIVSKEGFTAAGLTWNLNGSTLTDNSQNQEHIATITAKLGNAFTAPTIASTPVVPSGPSGGGTSSYGITVSTAENGTVKSSNSSAAKDATVTITVTPGEGYVLDTLTVTDKDNNTVALTKVSDTQYTFKMPASAVTVKATFKKDEGTQPAALPFNDVSESEWFYEAVKYVYDKGMMNGVSDTSFAPYSNLTRGMIAQVLYNLEGKPAVSGSAYTDVAADQWYNDAVNWAAQKGIVTGYGDGTFGPMDNITREQMAAILYRYAQYKGYDVSAKGDLTAFTDGNTVSDWAKDAMSWAVGTALFNGKGDGILDPTTTATRAEVAKILMTYCENVAK